MNLEALFELYDGLPRGGPGSEASTREALRRLAPRPSRPRVLDLGCGPGAQTLVLARELGGTVVGVDNHRPFLESLERAAREQGLEGRILAREGDMGALDEPPGSFDLIWSEGAIYNLGFQQGLRRWAPLLAPGGSIVVSEAVWLTDDPPAAAREFWEAEYPAIATLAATITLAREVGFSVYAHFPLPPSDWRDSYYGPLRERIALLQPRAASNPDLAQVLADSRHEIEMYERNGHSYGYAFLLMRPARE